MTRKSKPLDLKPVFLVLAITIAAFLFSGLIVKGSPQMALVVIVSIVVCLLAFLKPDTALYMLVFSMLLSPEFGQRSTEGSGVTVRVDDFLLVLIGLSWFARTALFKDLQLFRKTKLNLPILLYLFACIIATALGIVAGNVKLTSGFFFVLKYFEYYVVYFMVVNHVRSRSQVQYLIIAVLVTCVIVDLVAISQIPSGKRLSAPFEGDIGEPNTLGGYLVLMITLSLALLVSIESRRVKLVLLGVAGLTVVPFLLTLSRGSYLAIIPAYFALIFFARKKALLLMMLIVGLVSLPVVIPQSVINRVMHTFSQRTQSGQEKIGAVRIDTSTSIRLRSWTRGFEATMQRPVFGYGVSGWYFIDNQIMKILVETGFVGLSAFFFLLYSTFRESVKVLRVAAKDPFFTGITVGFLGGLAGMIVHGIGANTFIIVRIMEPFWLLAGIVMVIPEILKKEASENPYLTTEQFS